MERLSEEGKLFDKFLHTKDFPKRTDIKEEDITKKTTKERLFKDQNKKCNGCEVVFEMRNLTIDHIIPREKNGGSHYENLQLLCGHCNSIKGDRPMDYLMMKIEKRNKLMKYKIGFSGRSD